MIDFQKQGFFAKLKENPDYANNIKELLLENEQVIDSYKGIRDGVVFTDKRIIALNIQGITGKKRDYTSIPYSKIQTYSVETAGTFDRDSELEIYISSIGKLKFEFSSSAKIIEISKYISERIL